MRHAKKYGTVRQATVNSRICRTRIASWLTKVRGQTHTHTI